MADALGRLRESTTSLAGAASTIGAPTPTDPLSAQAMGASPNAAQMAGTPANKLSALRDSVREESTQGLDQRQEDHSKDNILSARMKQDAILAGTTGKLTDRISLINQEKMKATLTVTPIESLLPDEVKSDPILKGAISSFLKADATPAERAAGIRTLISKYPEANLSYDKLNTASSITGLTTVLRTLGVKDVTEESISKSIIASFPPALPISQVLSPSNAANWEAIFGPGAPPNALQDFLTATGANPNDNWASLGPKLKEWQQNKQQNWVTLQEQSRSTNTAVRVDAQNKLRELGYLGTESAMEKIGTVEQSVKTGGQFKLGDTTFDVAAMQAGDATQRGQLQDLLTKAVAGKLEDKTLEAQLKTMMTSGTLAGLLDESDIAPIKQIESTITANMSLLKGVNPSDPTQSLLTKETTKAFMDPALYEAMTTGTRPLTEQELPAWMTLMRAGGSAAVSLNTTMMAAGRYPGLASFIKDASLQQLQSTQITTKPETVLANFANGAKLSAQLESAKSGNMAARESLKQALVGDPAKFDAMRNLPPPFDVVADIKNKSGVDLGGGNDIVNAASMYLYTNATSDRMLNSPTLLSGFEADVADTGKRATVEAKAQTDNVNQYVKYITAVEKAVQDAQLPFYTAKSNNTKAVEDYQKYLNAYRAAVKAKFPDYAQKQLYASVQEAQKRIEVSSQQMYQLNDIIIEGPGKVQNAKTSMAGYTNIDKFATRNPDGTFTARTF